MRKALFLLVSMFSLVLSDCSIDYSTYIARKQKEKLNDTPTEEIISIDPSLHFYPSSLSALSNLISEYSYVDSRKEEEYTVYSAYFSETYDTIYISYDSVSTPVQTLKAKDLYEIERHAINYFISDKNRSEDKNYLQAVRIYPDSLASSCRKNIDSDDEAQNINGCANYGGKEATIDLNKTTSLEDFYVPKEEINGHIITKYEPTRDTFAHEYGHISTFYHMAYKNDENYDDYLKLRLQSAYNTIYPSGLPFSYSSDLSSYYTQPEEILADDFVELFYDTSEKKENDLFEYSLEYDNYRNSLKNHEEIQMLKESSLYYTIFNYYTSNFLDYDNKEIYQSPIIISKSDKVINYYDSYSKIMDEANIKQINSQNDVKLIAIGEVEVNNEKYYKVILSNTFKVINGQHNQKEVGKKIGYVNANDYSQDNTTSLYKLDRFNNEDLEINNLISIEDHTTLFILPFYDFSYVLNTTDNTNYATMYDYLNDEITNQTFRVNIYTYGTKIN